jgi:CspA family cold shock protein
MIALRGVTKWFDSKHGFGFIDVDGVDYFVHYRSIKMAGYKKLEEGQEVVFMGEKGDKGYFASEVIIVKPGGCS